MARLKLSKTKFTAADLENNLFDLANSVMNKNIEPKRVHAAVNSYKAILQLQALKLRTIKELNLKNRVKSSDTFLLD